MGASAQRLLLPVASVMLLAGVAASPSSATILPRDFEERTIAHRLIQPTDVDWAPDGRMFVAQKAGQVLAFNPDGTRAPAPVLDISDHVVDRRDRGLTGIAVDSDFASNGYLYLLYTYEANPDPDASQVGRLSRVVVNPDNTVVNPADPETVLLGTVSTAPCPPPDNTSDCIASEIPQHTHGTVRSDPADGTLWVGFGDDAAFDVVDERAFLTYDERSFAGKLLHIDRNGRGLPGHPFCPGDGDLDHVCTKLYAKGFRNPFRFTLRPDGGPIVGDVGSRAREEVDLVAPGRNYGWPCYEGSERTPEYSDHPDCATEYAKEGTADAAAPPVYSYPHNGASASITGGPRYDGSQFPGSYRGTIFFGDFVKGTLESLRLDASDALLGVDRFARALGGPVDIEVAPDGSLAYVDIRYGAVREIRHLGSQSPPQPSGLSLLRCVGVEALGCDVLSPRSALDGVNGLAISADGDDLYATAIPGGALSHFKRSGGLSFRSCVGPGVEGCESIAPIDALSGTHTVALSPDGESAYTASSFTGTVEHFELDPATGSPGFVDCIGRNRDGCAQSPVNALRGAHTVILSEDGGHAYVASTASDSVVHLNRSQHTGSLSFAGCVAQAIAGCTGPGGAYAIDDPHAVVLAPDGSSLYVPGYTSDTLTHFRRNGSTGSLTFVSCIGQAAPGCADLGSTDALDGAHSAAVSPDGRDVYTVAGLSGTVSHFRRNSTTGAIAFVRCIGRAAPGCDAFPGNGLEGAHWVTVSPDGRGVYVATRESSAVTRFDRDLGTGSLAYRGCVAHGASGCESLSPIEALGGEIDYVEVTPDGRSLFTASFSGDTLAELRLPTTAAPPGGSPPTGSVEGPTVFPTKPRILAVKKVASRRGVVFLGRIRSPERSCRARARTLLFRQAHGPDVRIGRARANGRGAFRIAARGSIERARRFYALVKARTIETGDSCASGRSAIFRAKAGRGP